MEFKELHWKEYRPRCDCDVDCQFRGCESESQLDQHYFRRLTEVNKRRTFFFTNGLTVNELHWKEYRCVREPGNTFVDEMTVVI